MCALMENGAHPDELTKARLDGHLNRLRNLKAGTEHVVKNAILVLYDVNTSWAGLWSAVRKKIGDAVERRTLVLFFK